MLNPQETLPTTPSYPIPDPSQTTRQHHQTISVFCAVIAITGVLIYWALQLGFALNDLHSSLRLLGLSFFVLFFPDAVCRAARLPGRPIPERWFFNEAMVVLYVLPLVYGAGALAPSVPAIGYCFTGVGYGCFAISVVDFARRHTKWYVLAGIPIALLFSLWATCRTLLPGMLETIVAGEAIVNIDFWFNAAFTNIIKTYSVPSTGLDGTPWMYYHYGCHFLFAQASKLLGVRVTEMFAAGYSIIFVPFFFKTYLSFAVTVRRFAFPGPGAYRPLNFLFWVLVLSIFIQLLRNIYSGGLLGYIFLDSVSYTVAMGVMFAFFSVCLYFWHGAASRSQAIVFGWVFLPAIMACLGFLKVSVMYNVLALAGYLFLRLHLYRKWYYWVSALLLLAVFGGVYPQVVETLTFGERKVGYEGRIEFFYFFTGTHQFRPLVFILFFHQWLYLLIFLTLYQYRAFGRLAIGRLIRERKTLAVECGLVLVITGLLPSFFLHLSGGNAMYFMGTQLFFCSALALGYLNDLRFSDLPAFRLPAVYKRWAYSLFFAATLVVLFARTQFVINDLLRANTNTRKKLLSVTDGPKFTFTQVVQLGGAALTGRYSAAQERYVTWFSPAVQRVLDRDTSYRFLRKVYALDELPLARKHNSAIYINFTTYQVPFKVPCGIVPFFIPSLGGMATLNGQPYDCPMGGWGFEYYNTRYKHHPGWDKIFTRAELCTHAAGKHYGELMLFNEREEKFEFVHCPQ